MKRNFLSESIEFQYNNGILPKYYVIKPFYNGEIFFDYCDVYDPYLYTWEYLWSLITLNHVSILEPELYKQKKDIKMKKKTNELFNAPLWEENKPDSIDGLITILSGLKNIKNGSLYISDLKVTVQPSLEYTEKVITLEMSSFKCTTTIKK